LPWSETVKAELPEGLDSAIIGEETLTVFAEIFGTQQPITTAGPPVRLDTTDQTATMRSKIQIGTSHTLPAFSSVSGKYLRSFSFVVC
jgi:hypothetical protein